MRRDRVKEDAQKGSLDRITSFGMAALTIGVGAASFYRLGGSKVLSEGLSISQKVLRESADEVFSRKPGKTSTQEIKNLYGKIFKEDDSIIKKAIRDGADEPIRLRKDNPNNLIGMLSETYSTRIRHQERITREMFESQYVKVPVANKYIGELAADAPEKARNIERFVHEVAGKHKDAKFVDKTLKKHNIEQDFGIEKAKEMLSYIEERMRDKSEYEGFRIRQQGVFMDADKEALDPENIARIAGSAKDKKSKGGFFDKILGDARVTVDDLLNDPDRYQGNLISSVSGEDGDKVENVAMEATEFLKKMKARVAEIHGEEKAQDFGKLYIDETLRKNTEGEVYSFKGLAEAGHKLLDRSGDTIVGQVLKTRNLAQRASAPNFLYTAASGIKADPILAAITNNVEKASVTPDQDFFRIYDRTYKVSEGALEHMKELDGTFLTSIHDTRSKLINQISGNVDYKSQDNKLFRFLDIGQSGAPNYASLIRAGIEKKKSPKATVNVLKSFTETPEEMYGALKGMQGETVDKDALFDIVDQVTGLNKFYSRNASRLSRDSVESLSELTTGRAKEYFDALKLGDEDLLDWIMTKDGSSIRDSGSHINQDLSNLIYQYMDNPKRMRDQFSLRNDGATGKRASNLFDALRIEIGKEGFMSHAVENGGEDTFSYTAVKDLLENAPMAKQSKDSAKWLAEWSALQHAGEVSNAFTKNKEINALVSDSKRVVEMFLVDPTSSTKDAEFFGEMKQNLARMSKIGAGAFDETYGFFKENADLVNSTPTGEWVHVKKMVSPLDLIGDLNNKSKKDAFVKQFYAGRDNMENVTNATFFPYFALSRIPEALGKIGLDFSPESTGSVFELSKSIMAKRVLPVAVGLTALSYLNDMTDEITGTSLTGAFASGLANIDLGMRTISDVTGFTQFMKTEKEINPLLSYWTGDEYMNREEREDWYKNGYQEVRKSKWWNFGSLNELRGSSVQYYQPNYLKRAHSDWKDKSLYDSHWEKWNHSILPTPTNPLSPLVYLSNPYWLEDKHKEDRPYPMSSPLFSEETPWGVVLNPTLGQLIKPRVEMHADRLDNRLVDVKAIIEKRNIEQFERAKNKSDAHVVRFRDGSIEPVDFTALQAPTVSERVLSLRTYGGEIQSTQGPGAFQMPTGLMDVQEYISGDDTGEGGGSGQGGQGPLSGGGSFSGGGGEIEGLSFIDRAQIKAMGGNIPAKILSTVFGQNDSAPTYDIESINEGIKARARVSGSKPREKGVVTPESIYRTEARYGKSILGNEEARSDLRGLTSGDDFIGELAYTGKYIGGIYGYGANMAFQGGSRNKLADGSQMNSASRKIWDANIGGLGGGYAEIFRRFLPDQNRMVNRINPLMNTMPDWMPDRFRTGDPYISLPKGEMRLPGKGYEALHDLHSDMYGEYGAFDRFKILADISPGSKEYKTWRDIAGKTVKDPLLREEMQRIKDRVTEQSKKYDFSNYQFIGQETERKSVVVDEVLNNNFFTVVGDNEVYRMAGISMGNTEDGESPLKEMLKPGMDVVLSSDKNEHTGRNDDEHKSKNAAVFIDGVSLNKKLMDEGYATRRQADRSAAASEGIYSDFQRARGHVYEAIAHLPIPFYQQKYFKIRDPLESYKHELVYGTPFATWGSPIDSFLKPAFERSLMSNTEMAVGAAAFAVNQFVKNTDLSPGWKKASKMATLATNRGAFMGNYLGRVFGKGKPAEIGMMIGAGVQAAGWAYTRRDQPVAGTAGLAILGGYIGNMVEDVGTKKGAIIGAIAGLAITSGSSVLDGDIDNKYIPERTRKKWEMQEYFDRLEYVKYSGMFEKSAKMAQLFEGTDIKEIISQYETSRAENEKMRKELEESRKTILESYGRQDERTQRLLGEISERLSLLNEEELLMSAGKHTRSALAYRQAMDSTNYGLKEGATWSQLLRSLPAVERDHFMEFAKETDPKRQKEILEYVSPHQKRALQIAWGQNPDKQESMLSYFTDKHLPRPTWSGWRPNVDLKDIEVKTIHNEGMMLADFGYYESELRNPDVINADNISPDDGNGGALSLAARLTTSLQGAGLFGVDVKIEPSQRMGIQVVADIARATTYNLEQRVGDFFRI